MSYIPVIGLEVHVELSTKSKMFCGCSAYYFGEEPNTHTCPVCLGLPGALPVPNEKAIEGCVMIGLALNCDIPLFSKFDRKNYFYPDLAKGYQISQYDEPFCINGYIELSSGKRIRIKRVHMEEDTGKLIHGEVDGEKVSLIDFNRSGVPLVEIVTEADFDNAQDVKEYLQKLQQIVRYLGVATADMEKGEMRCEPNISLREERKLNEQFITDDELPHYKVEVKNINSFSFAEKAIEYEIKRHAELLDKGEIPAQETRGFVEAGSKTVSQRSKEEAHDYRYFPEPDIPPIRWTEEQILAMKAKMPELPDTKKSRFIADYGLSEYAAEQLVKEKETADYFEECIRVSHPELVSGSQEMPNLVRHDVAIKQVANYILNKKVDMAVTLPAELVALIIAENKLSGIPDTELTDILQKVISTNEDAVVSYKSGKENVLNVLVGAAMRELKGKEKPDAIRFKIVELING